jgi:hypothetical protein
MSNSWQPKNWEEVCKRNAGRRKLHMRKREERANRIVRLLAAMENAPELRESAYGWLSIAAETMKMSKATASRDFALARRIHSQFVRMFGRTLKPGEDHLIWSWDWSHYGFRTSESYRAGHRKPVGHFPFDTRDIYADDAAYCGFNPLSWQGKFEERGLQYKGGNLFSILRSLKRLKV